MGSLVKKTARTSVTCNCSYFRGSSRAVAKLEDTSDAGALKAIAGNFDLSLVCEDGVAVRAHRAVVTPHFGKVLEALRDTSGGDNPSSGACSDAVAVVGGSRTWELIKYSLYEPYLRGLAAPDASSPSRSSRLRLLNQVSRQLPRDAWP